MTRSKVQSFLVSSVDPMARALLTADRQSVLLSVTPVMRTSGETMEVVSPVILR